MTRGNVLLHRNEFRHEVFIRDKELCVFCKLPARDAHHIMERRLFPDGGYYLDNGISVCEGCHMLCEETTFSPSYCRLAAGIKNVILPPHLYDDQEYDKWGNPIMPNGQRLRGELFDDYSVKKVIARHLTKFTDYVKYPRTYHLPWSEGITKDDRVMKEVNIPDPVVVTEKMDGENTTMYHDHIHARSIDSKSHYSRDYVKNLWARTKRDIPRGWRVCGENLWAQHSIKYTNLPDLFLVFSIWNDKNVCLGWEETLYWAALLNLKTVPVLYEGSFVDDRIKDLYKPGIEGYVVRWTGAFHYFAFKEMVAKFVRKDHVKTTKHWFTGQQLEKNEKVS